MIIQWLMAKCQYTTGLKACIFILSLLLFMPMTYKFVTIVNRSGQTLALEHVFVYCLICLIVYMAMKLYHIGIYLLSFSLATLGFALIFIVFEASNLQRILGAACLFGAVILLFIRKKSITQSIRE